MNFQIILPYEGRGIGFSYCYSAVPKSSNALTKSPLDIISRASIDRPFKDLSCSTKFHHLTNPAFVGTKERSVIRNSRCLLHIVSHDRDR